MATTTTTNTMTMEPEPLPPGFRELPPENPHFAPSEAYARLEREAAEWRERQAANEAAERKKHEVDPELYRRALESTAAEIARKLGCLPMTFEELNKRPEPEAAWSLAERVERARQLRRERFERICPPLYAEPWDKAKVKPEVSLLEVGKIFGWQFGPKGLYVAGESGHSKTRAVYQLARRLLVVENRSLEIFDGVAFSNLCTRAFGDPAETERMFRPLIACDVLVIDDLAKRWTPATEEGMFMVLDRRTANKRPVIVTLNYTAQDLFNMQGARGELAILKDVTTPLIRRLVDYCETVVL